jgi:hypothetical protein
MRTAFTLFNPDTLSDSHSHNIAEIEDCGAEQLNFG